MTVFTLVASALSITIESNRRRSNFRELLIAIVELVKAGCTQHDTEPNAADQDWPEVIIREDATTQRSASTQSQQLLAVFVSVEVRIVAEDRGQLDRDRWGSSQVPAKAEAHFISGRNIRACFIVWLAARHG